MRPLERLEEYRNHAVALHDFPPDSRLVVEIDGTYLERIDKDSFCCGTTLHEHRIKLK